MNKRMKFSMLTLCDAFTRLVNRLCDQLMCARYQSIAASWDRSRSGIWEMHSRVWANTRLWSNARCCNGLYVLVHNSLLLEICLANGRMTMAIVTHSRSWVMRSNLRNAKYIAIKRWSCSSYLEFTHTLNTMTCSSVLWSILITTCTSVIPAD